jgi:hypothetical protein
LVSAQPFAVLGVGDTYKTDASEQKITDASAPSMQDVSFSYDASTNTYQISLPGFQSGPLTNIGYNGSSGQVATSTTSQVGAGTSGSLQPVFVMLPVPGNSYSPYTYTSYGNWNGKTGASSSTEIVRNEGYFAYGIPTQAGDMPISGTATYKADIYGSIGPVAGLPLSGDVNLLFDFAAGKLSGSMHPGVFDSFDGIVMDFGRYDFTQTVYSSGSTTFSGKFVVPGLPDADSAFDGRFTGPKAEELMARFRAPYIFNGQQGTMSGVWVGKKH